LLEEEDPNDAFTVPTAAGGSLSRSVRHHWDALSCAEVLRGSMISQAEVSGSAANISKFPDMISIAGSTTLGNMTDKGGNGTVIAAVPSDVVKVKSTPCKSMKEKYSVLQGISWGTLSLGLQR
jgi:hypothetical protein